MSRHAIKTGRKKITKPEQDLRRKFNRLKRTRRKIEKEMWDTMYAIHGLMYRREPTEDEP